MVYLNKTDDKVRVCDTQAKYGCCSACFMKDCCFCKYDGEKDIIKDLLETVEPPLKIRSKITRGFSIQRTDESKAMSNLYEEVLRQLGFEGTAREWKSYKHVKNFSYMPPGGFIMWHTNQYDNNQVAYRMYIMNVDVDGGSAFKYQLPSGEMVEVLDFHGAVRIFKNTHKDTSTNKELYLWHTAYSTFAHRLSIGFEIHPEQIVALLDTCGESCWNAFQKLDDFTA